MEKIKVTPTEHVMLMDDEEALLSEMDEHKIALIELEKELQVMRHKTSSFSCSAIITGDEF